MKHFLLAMATLWCVAGTFSLFAADNNKWKPLFGKNLENANYNPEVWSETDGVLGAVKTSLSGQRMNMRTSSWILILRPTWARTAE